MPILIAAPFTFTNANTAAVSISSAQGKFNPSSLFNNHSSTTTPYGQLSGIDPTVAFPSSGWTVEMWIYPITANNGRIFAASTANRCEFYVNLSSQKIFYSLGNGTTYNIYNTTGSLLCPLNKWTHIALVYDGTGYRSYLNGCRDLNITTASTNCLDGVTSFLFTGTTQGRMSGYIDEVRFSKTARYSSVAHSVPQVSFSDQSLVDDNVYYINTFYVEGPSGPLRSPWVRSQWPGIPPPSSVPHTYLP